jgi:PIN domain nuclease of toxin-antitoxin system
MILLDTNALLWVYRDDRSLGEEARDRIGRASRVMYSAVSVMEITMKHMLGRVPLPGDGDLPAAFARSGLMELPFTAQHAATLLRFPTLARHDPFDRMLLAQATSESCDLLTSDATLLALGEARVHDARA